MLVPALRVPGVGEYQRENAFQGVLAISSAALVDDPGQADAVRQADATSSGPAEGARACGTAGAVAVCTSQPSPAADAPVLLTAFGERYEPVGASGCQPLFSLEAGDGSDPQSFLPRSGTVITARVTHTYADPGTYTVVVRSVSRCSTPASPGGTEQEYDYSAQLTITVTG